MGVCRCPIVRQTRHSELLHPVPILRCHMSRDRQRTPLVAVAPKSTGLLSYDQWCMFHFCLFGSMSNPSTWLSYECLKNFVWWYDQEKQKKELLCLYLLSAGPADSLKSSGRVWLLALHYSVSPLQWGAIRKWPMVTPNSGFQPCDFALHFNGFGSSGCLDAF